MVSITHEAEVQRQHTRYRIPLTVTIAGKEYQVLDWSVAGLAMSGTIDGAAVGATYPIRLMFPFETFGMNLDGEAEVVYMDGEKKRVGMRFVNTTRQFANMTRFIIDAYISGEVVSAGDLLEVSARHYEAKPRAEKSAGPVSPAQRLRRMSGRVARIAAVAMLTVGLTAFVAVSINERLFYVPANTAVISTDLVTIPAPTSGSLAFLATEPEVSRGDPVAAIETIDGKQIYVNSPCDCANYMNLAQIGDFVTLGTPLISFRRPDAKPYIAAYVELDRAVKIMEGARAVARLADGSRIEDDDLTFIPPSERSDGGSQMMKVVMKIDEKLAASRIGQPVSLYFDTGTAKSWRHRLPETIVSMLE